MATTKQRANSIQAIATGMSIMSQRTMMNDITQYEGFESTFALFKTVLPQPSQALVDRAKNRVRSLFSGLRQFVAEVVPGGRVLGSVADVIARSRLGELQNTIEQSFAFSVTDQQRNLDRARLAQSWRIAPDEVPIRIERLHIQLDSTVQALESENRRIQQHLATLQEVSNAAGELDANATIHLRRLVQVSLIDSAGAGQLVGRLSDPTATLRRNGPEFSSLLRVASERASALDNALLTRGNDKELVDSVEKVIDKWTDVLRATRTTEDEYIRTACMMYRAFSELAADFRRTRVLVGTGFTDNDRRQWERNADTLKANLDTLTRNYANSVIRASDCQRTSGSAAQGSVYPASLSLNPQFRTSGQRAIALNLEDIALDAHSMDQ
jgi:acetolactate synthase small subunit